MTSIINGDTITIKEGTYIENVMVDKRLTIKAEDGANVIIRAKEDDKGVIVIGHDGCGSIVQGLNIISSSVASGLALSHSYDNTFINNTITNSTKAIYLYYSGNNTIINKMVSGTDPTKIIIDAENSGRMFTINHPLNVTIENLILKRGYVTGDSGVIYNNWGNLTIKNCHFDDNKAFSAGGAITNVCGSCTLINCYFLRNNATGTYSVGGAIYNPSGTLNINYCLFNGNTAYKGGAIYNGGICNITNVTQFGNYIVNVASYGGAIYNYMGTVNAHYNSFLGNRGIDVFRDTDAGGIVNAQNNWWGTTFEGTNPQAEGRVNNGVNVEPWLI